MSATLIDSGVVTVADLAGLLPAGVRDRIGPELLRERPSASALRVLATIKNPFWHAHVRGANIAWPALLADVRGFASTTDSVLIRAEIAASLAGHVGLRVTLLDAARRLDGGNFLAVLDAMRIANRGLTS